MKKNSNNIITSAIAMAAVTLTAIFTACSNNDDPVIDDTTMVSTYTITVDADLVSDNTTTRALDIDGTGVIKSTWAATDKVAVYYKSKFVGTLSPSTTGTASTTLTGTLSFSETPNKSNKLYLYYPATQSYNDQHGTLASIAETSDCANAQVSITDIDNTNKIITTGDASFTKQQAIVKFTLKDNGGTPISTSQFTVADGTCQLIASMNGEEYVSGNVKVTSASPTNELYVALRGISNSTIILTANVGTDIYTYCKSDVTFENGKYYTVSVKMKKVQGVQLWENGPYWATENLGAYGEMGRYSQHFQWGNITPVYGNLGFANDWNGSPFNDAATYYWRDPWRMPTKEEFDDLIANTTQSADTNEENNGMVRFTGKGNYSDKYICLPKTGYFSGSTSLNGRNYGHYWTSTPYNTPYDNNNAWEFTFGVIGSGSTSHNGTKTRACAIRPVHD